MYNLRSLTILLFDLALGQKGHKFKQKIVIIFGLYTIVLPQL